MGCISSKSLPQIPRFQKQKLPSVEIVNNTEKTVGLRDREREVYGILRHKVKPSHTERVEVNLKDAGTYYRMAVLVMVDDGDDSKVEPTIPPLFIDTEDLIDQKRITIERKNNKYVLEKSDRV